MMFYCDIWIELSTVCLYGLYRELDTPLLYYYYILLLLVTIENRVALLANEFTHCNLHPVVV